MKKTWMFAGMMSTAMVVLVALLAVAGTVVSAAAQDQGDAAQFRNREETRNTAQAPQGDALHQRIRERIEKEEGLQTQERERLREHLEECKRLGLEDEKIAALFDESQPLRRQIRAQERVLAMAREGLPIEPVTLKLQEGRRKGASEEVLERICARMEEHVRAANRVMERARAEGLAPGNPDDERRRTREMAMHMWRGLREEDMDQLRERAHLRLRDGSCTTGELVAAAETASKLKEMGIERHRAVRLAGEALQYGYTAREMRQLGWMVMTAHMHGGPNDEVFDTLERGIRNQHQLAEMMQQMWQRGWMGPGDEHGGRGGYSPMNDARGGGPGDQKGQDRGPGNENGQHGGGGQQGGQGNG